MMSSKTKNTMYLFMMMLIGGVSGYFLSSRSIPRPDNFQFNPSLYYNYDVIFGGLAAACIVFTLVIFIRLWKLSVMKESHSNPVEDGLTQGEKAVGSLIKLIAYNLNTNYLWIALSLAYMASKEGRAATDDSYVLVNIVGSCIFLIVAVCLQVITFRHYNRLYPNRSINVESPRADRELFDKLDEAERYIVYRSAHSSLKAVNLLLLIGVLLFILYSIMVEFTPLPIIVLAVVSIVQKVVYFREVSKLGG